MCLAIPGKVVSIKNNKAIVDYFGEKRETNLINKDVKVGDYVIVQNKIIVDKIPEKDALESLNEWKKALN